MTGWGLTGKRRLVVAIVVLVAAVAVLGGMVVRDMVTGRTPWTRVTDGGGQ